MGIVATISRIKPDRFEQMRKDNKFPYGYETENAYIDKCWEIIAYVLVGKLDNIEDEILSEVIFPKERIDTYKDEHYAEGFNYSTPNRVKTINEQLKLIDEPVFTSLFEKRDFEKMSIYPFWNKAEIDKKYLLDNFNSVFKLYESAAENNEYVVIVIGD
jgi:Domain of unknown function (DUF1877)